jgi:hypothetical protein
MRTRFGLLGGVLILALGAGIAALAYQAGLNQGAATAAAAGSVVVIGGGSGGFGIIGILLGLFFLFLLARLVIGVTFGAFGWGRGPWAGGGRHRGRAWFDGPSGGPGTGGPRGPWGDRETFVAEMHRRLHERDAAAQTGPSAQAAPGRASGRRHARRAGHSRGTGRPSSLSSSTLGGAGRMLRPGRPFPGRPLSPARAAAPTRTSR